MSKTLIDCQLDGKSFGPNKILGAIRFQLGRGQRVAITGASGVGKTTLLRILSGQDRSFDGGYTVSGRLGYVFQEPNLLPWLSAIDNLIVATDCDAQFASEILDRVGLTGKSDHYPHQLSLGQQRRLSIARALAYKPDVLVMDEAFTSLDEATHGAMIALVKTLLDERKIALLLVTHSRAEADALCEKTYVLRGNPAELFGLSE